MNHELFMQRALQLALLGQGHVAPNPMVGCVIVHNGRIIGEGWHRQYGQAHAEVNALNSVIERHLLPESTVYVTLEPCSHFGKTPPCADRLVQEGVKEVIVCNDDPNPLVAGRGLNKLRQAGIQVQTGILAQKGRELNRRFFTWIEQQRPYVILKWAQTADGFLAGPDYQPVPISGPLAQRLVHRWRSEEDAIWIGTHTARTDNPRLNVRAWTGRNPLRIIPDRTLSLPPDLHVFDGSQPTLVFTEKEREPAPNLTYATLSDWSLTAMLADLKTRNIQSILVEGGTRLLESFLAEGCWDEIRLFRSSAFLKKGIPAPHFTAKQVLRERVGVDELTVWHGA